MDNAVAEHLRAAIESLATMDYLVPFSRVSGAAELLPPTKAKPLPVRDDEDLRFTLLTALRIVERGRFRRAARHVLDARAYLAAKAAA